MKLLIHLILVVFLVAMLNPYLPFWGVMIVLALLAAGINSGAGAAFLSGGIGMLMAWVGMTLYIRSETQSDLPEKMASLFGLDSTILLLLITAFFGFLFGSFSSWTGQLFRNLFENRRKNIYGA